jgi:uncharacterized protein YprB with RNaseH-like and TPR domain
MDMKSRLNALRSQTGSQLARDAEPPVASSGLAQRLARLQHTRRHARPQREPLDDAALANVVGGKVLADGVLLIEQLLPLPHAGLIDLRSCLPDLPDAVGLNAADWVFVDTETSGLAGGTGTIAFMLGMARVEQDRLMIRQYLLSRFAGERAMLVHALMWLGEHAGLVSYNGKSFDLPLLKTRTRLAGLQPAAWERPHLDLLYGVRRAFEGRWPDCRLVTVEQRLLGVQRHDDLPGSEAPAAWLAHLQQGDAARLAGVLTHNCQDLVSLAGLLPRLAAVHRAPHSHQGDSLRVARRWLRVGAGGRARSLLERALPQLDSQAQLLLASLRRRDGEQRAAVALLEGLAGQGNCEAVEQLAKHHEHTSRDLGSALRYALALPASDHRRRRLERLRAKRGHNGELPF